MANPRLLKMIERARYFAKGLYYCAEHDTCESADDKCPCHGDCPQQEVGIDVQSHMLGTLLEEMADELDIIKDSLASMESLCDDWKAYTAAAEDDCARFSCSTCGVTDMTRTRDGAC